MLHLRLALLSTVCLLPYMAAPALAARAGVTAAVNQSALGTPPGGGVRTIVLGADIVTDEKIDTTGQGLVQILLADGTTFTVGPNSSLTIDHFVYDPNAGTAQVTASLAKGVFRFIGARTSKTPNGVELNTPVGTVGIRGAVADINLLPNHNNGIRAEIDLLFGQEVTLTQCPPHPQHPLAPCSGRLLQRLYQAGYSIIIGSDGQIHLVKTPPGSTNLIQLALTGRQGTHGGAPHGPNNNDVASSGMPPTNSDHPPSDNTPPLVFPLPPPTDFGDTTQVATTDNTHTDAGNATPITPTQPSDDRYSGTFTGFSAGVATGYVESSGGAFEHIDDPNPYGPTLLQSNNPDDTSVDFSPSTNSIGGRISNITVDDYSYNLKSVSVGFGDGQGGTSNFASNDSYGATGPSSSASAELQGQSGPGSGGTGTVVTGGISGFAPCTCAYLQWGSWATDFDAQGDFGTPSQGHVTVANGTWVTGNIPGDSAFDTYSLTQAGITATYTGQATGNWVLGPSTGTATGSMTMTYDLGARTGELGISGFDGYNFSSAVSGNGSGPLFSGSAEGLAVNGAFASDGTDLAHGVLGNFQAGNGDWNATGIFAGQVTSTAPSPGN